MFQPNQQIGPYVLLHQLGQGGFGEVWLAEKRNSLLPRQVALKLPLDPDPDLGEIQKEAQIWLHAGHHPNVLPVIDAEVFNGQVAIASEYASGGSLKEWLKQNGGKTPSVETAVAMISGILLGLEHLHSLKPQPIIHRDLKPDNILLQDGVPRLTDFGISRVMKTTGYSTHSSGTPSYMPPEAFEGRYSVQSDLWAVGVILYQMLTGRLPFPQHDIPSLYGAIKSQGYAALPPDTPPVLRNVIAQALAKEPGKRFASAAAMRAALIFPPKATPKPPPKSPDDTTIPDDLKKVIPPPPPPPPMGAWIGGALLLLIVVFGAAKLRPHPKPDDHKNDKQTDNKQVDNKQTNNTQTLNTTNGGLNGILHSGLSNGSGGTTPVNFGNLFHKSPLDSPLKLFPLTTSPAWSQIVPTTSVNTLAYSPDSRMVVTAGANNAAILWDVASGLPLHTLTGHLSSVSAAAWSPDGKAVVTTSSGGTAIAWKLSP